MLSRVKIVELEPITMARWLIRADHQYAPSTVHSTCMGPQGPDSCSIKETFDL